MKFIKFLVLALFVATSVFAADGEKEKFEIVKEVKHTPVISQGRTGTCWSFATTSFLESEIMRKGFPETDLSEMFFVQYNYINKATQYLLYHGNNNFGQGSLSHDVMKIVTEQGMASYKAFPGIKKEGKYNHSELERQLKEEANIINKQKKGEIDVSNLKVYDKIFKEELGKLPKHLKVDGEKLSPIEYRDHLGINPEDYVELSSYAHHPYYKQFVLEVPDNWAHALYYNLPIDELMEVMYYALNNGFSIAWDGDTSEKTFTHKSGKADLPKKQIGKVNQELRQKTFYNRTSTDDHLMHLVGLSKDADNRNCFYTKNSWGDDSNKHGGYLHMTDDYVRLKTVGILLHKDAIPASIKVKLGL